MTNLSRILELAGIKESDHSATILSKQSLEDLQTKKLELEAQLRGCTIFTEHMEDLKFKLLNVNNAIKALDESENKELLEKAPADQEEFVKSAKGDFKKRYGKRWKEVLYATANARHNKNESNHLEIADKIFETMDKGEGTEILGEMDDKEYVASSVGQPDLAISRERLINVIETMGRDASLVIPQIDDGKVLEVNFRGKTFSVRKKGVNEAKSAEEMQNLQPSAAIGKDEIANVFDGPGEEKSDVQNYHNDTMGITQDEETKVTVPSDVFSQIDKRIGELKQSIELYDKTTYQEQYSNKLKAIENLEFIRDKLKIGTMETYKQAQHHYGTLASIYAGNLFPAKLVDFLHDGQANLKGEVAYGDYSKGKDANPESKVPHNALYKPLNTSIYPQKGEDNKPKN